MVTLRPLRPVSRRFPVTNPFGRRGSYAAGYHTGTDFAAPYGTPVRAPRSGTVVFSGYDSSYGNNVMIKEWTGKKVFLLAHMSSRSVVRGQKVLRGKIVGRVGSTGNSTGNHVHAEQRRSPFGYWEHEKPGWED